MVRSSSKSTETLTDLDLELELILDYLDSDNPEEKALAESLFETSFLPRLEKKIDSYVELIKAKEASRNNRLTRAKELTQLAKSDENVANWLLNKLLNCMERRVEQLGEKGKKLEGAFCRVSLCNNGGKQPVFVNPEFLVDDCPNEYVELVPTLDLNKLKEDALSAGEVIDRKGRILAKAMPRGKHLRLL